MLNEIIRNLICTVVIVMISSSLAYAEDETKGKKVEKQQPMAHGLGLPISGLLDQKTRKAHERAAKKELPFMHCPGGEYPFRNDNAILVRRLCVEKNALALLSKLKESYQVDIQPMKIGNIYTESITPAEGISKKNTNRVLMNLHGGAIAIGARTGGQLESIAVAATGKIKIIGVDYRMYPEHVFPAATDDAIAVYKELLKSYTPNNIGIYGYSDGAVLTAQTLVRLQREGLPKPGAVGMLCGAAIKSEEGDSNEMLARSDGELELLKSVSYFKYEDYDNPLISPGKYPKILKQFPPSLLVSSTRDHFLSSVVFTHSQLVKLNVNNELHVYEGLGHCGFINQDVPEFVESNNVVVNFFDKYLGRNE